MAKRLSEASILMISLDPQFLRERSDVVRRHHKYAQNLKRLDVLVLSGKNGAIKRVSDNFSVYGVGGGLLALQRAYRLGSQLEAKHHYDLVDTQDPHATGLVGYWLARRWQRPLEVHFHGDFWQNDYWLQESWKNAFYNFIQKKIVRQAQAIRVVSPKIKDKLVTSGIAPEKITVINTPINEEAFAIKAEAEKVQEIERKYGQKILLFVGRLVASKNLPFMLQALKALQQRRQDFVLLIIGEGSRRNQLLGLIDQYKLQNKVFLLGEKEQHILADYYQAAYLLLLLSTNESFGKVIIEAGLRQTPTLASHTLGAATIINDNQTGWLVAINNLKQTVDKLDLLLSDYALVEKVGRVAQAEYALSYDQALTHQKILDFWQKIITAEK